MVYEIIRIARGKETVEAIGSLKKMRALRRQLRTSTMRGASGRMGRKYPVKYILRKSAEG